MRLENKQKDECANGKIMCHERDTACEKQMAEQEGKAKRSSARTSGGYSVSARLMKNKLRSL